MTASRTHEQEAPSMRRRILAGASLSTTAPTRNCGSRTGGPITPAVAARKHRAFGSVSVGDRGLRRLRVVGLPLAAAIGCPRAARVKDLHDIDRIRANRTLGSGTRDPNFVRSGSDHVEVRSGSGHALAGADGEALDLPTPPDFRVHHRGLRMLVPPDSVLTAERRRARNVSPAASGVPEVAA